MSPVLAGRFFTTEPQGKPHLHNIVHQVYFKKISTDCVFIFIILFQILQNYILNIKNKNSTKIKEAEKIVGLSSQRLLRPKHCKHLMQVFRAFNLCI